jgi:hypothetical protein
MLSLHALKLVPFACRTDARKSQMPESFLGGQLAPRGLFDPVLRRGSAAV